jgi:hypothetical protein
VLVEEGALEGAEELFGLCHGQPERLDALGVFLEGDDIGAGLFLIRSVAEDPLEFDPQRGASPGARDSGRTPAILLECFDFPQHLPALPA